MDKTIAHITTDGDEQIVLLPEDINLPGEELKITRIGNALVLEPVTEWSQARIAAWAANMDAYRDLGVPADWLERPPMPPDDSDE